MKNFAEKFEKIITRMSMVISMSCAVEIVLGIIALIVGSPLAMVTSVLDKVLPATFVLAAATVSVMTMFFAWRDGHKRLGIASGALFAAVTGVLIWCAYFSQPASATPKVKAKLETTSKHVSLSSMQVDAPQDGVFFNSENVVEEFETGKGENMAYWVMYDDPDAEINEPIRLTLTAYKAVISAIKSGKQLSGHLKAVKANESIVYDLITK